jgi:NAD+ synthase (glutamine-hydrolysing)
VLAESKRFSRTVEFLYADIDIARLENERLRQGSFGHGAATLPPSTWREVVLGLPEWEPAAFSRHVDQRPFVPSSSGERDDRCAEIFAIQTAGLAKRIEHTGAKSVVVGISGGLDSTLALLVAVRTLDLLNRPRSGVIAITMPGFGTTEGTYGNALELIKTLGATVRDIDIKEACLRHFADIGHDPAIHDVTYENVQARERTQILMDIANAKGGFVIGTGDLSEMALGWSTYNGDHMSMYAVNCSVPKTLVRYLVEWVADNVADKGSAEVLRRIVDTPISPELLPPAENGEIRQKTEDIVGPYDLHDFFLYYHVRFGAGPEKVLFLAERAFAGRFDRATIVKWLEVFYRRFFAQQFKRSCTPDGPKVGSVSLSPRGDWRMPSDASVAEWLARIDSCVQERP